MGAAALGSVAAGVAAWQIFRPAKATTEALYALQLPDADGRLQAVAQWRGRVLVANFWATWCEPCREEMPALVAAQQAWRSKGVQIVGIGIDSAAKIRDFAVNYKISYPLLVSGPEVLDVARHLGNSAGGLPYTVVLARDGAVSGRHLGALQQGQIDSLLARATADA
jgi:thiol-disulfide isomerase/thioredoxin